MRALLGKMRALQHSGGPEGPRRGRELLGSTCRSPEQRWQDLREGGGCNYISWQHTDLPPGRAPRRMNLQYKGVQGKQVSVLISICST